jgi:hypothetical protein
MLDRAIGIAGIALALIFGVVPFTEIKIPTWVSLSGAGLGILLIGLAAGLILGDQRKPDATSAALADSAQLRLHIYADDRTPGRISFENIWRWYYLKTLMLGLDKDTGKELQRNVLATLFISFDTPVKVGTLEVSSPDMRLPIYEVKEFNNRYAIIVFRDNLPAGTLDVGVHQ